MGLGRTRRSITTPCQAMTLKGRLLSQSVEPMQRAAGPERVARQQAKLLQLHSLVRTRAAVSAQARCGRLLGDWITVNVGATLAEIERQAILSTLRFCRDNKRETAKILGMSLKTLYTRLALYKGLSHSTGENS